jgi:hypothetical protein
MLSALFLSMAVFEPLFSFFQKVADPDPSFLPLEPAKRPQMTIATTTRVPAMTFDIS